MARSPRDPGPDTATPAAGSGSGRRDDRGRDRERREERREERRRRDVRLDLPGRRKRSVLPRFKFGGDSFGEFAEGFARFMGTAAFLIGMSVFVITWLVWNTIADGPLEFDEYPFILLTLMLSLQASYAAPLILLAQNRQEARDRVGVERDREQAAQSRADMDFLAREIASLRMSVGELATRDYLRRELREVLEELEQERRESEASGDHDR
ncbi:DUF1003 domain-containing protein [Microlunatus sp. Y2014]|uniref:DUF1003 domain-containing protein n=1 Tax=Microlunatus sp. Y2014 TaxID=3418488 RepID=UPI003DA7A09C